MTHEGKCIILSAPSGAGKTTIVRHLLKQFPELSFSISATSRTPRPLEEHGLHYHFLSTEQFRKSIDDRDFLEWEEVYPGRYYGTLKSEIDRVWADNKHLIFDVDVVGGSNLKKHFGKKALAIFVKPPSLDVLDQRLRKRSTEDESSLKERIDKAAHELAYSDHFDVVLINDVLDVACDEATDMVKKFLQT